MHELVGRLASDVVDVDRDLEREFEARLTESSTLAFRVAYSVLRHREDAEDVAQEAFARAYRAFHQLRERERFRAWLVRLTWRLALDRRRGDRRREARELAHAELQPFANGPESVDANYRSRELWRAIDTLPDKLRMALVLASIEGHDLAEVAALLRLPLGTVKSRLFLARRRLKEQLEWIR
ncbi:MAG TPA: RNA polymerase sigma factor [Vicinamibacterales bacterium]|nr:RNA polymerase sigma factor [Vicinamibacterales bacterium]